MAGIVMHTNAAMKLLKLQASSSCKRLAREQSGYAGGGWKGRTVRQCVKCRSRNTVTNTINGLFVCEICGEKEQLLKPGSAQVQVHHTVSSKASAVFASASGVNPPANFAGAASPVYRF